jgi:hypothetical protein
MIDFKCELCGAEMESPQSQAGKVETCPQCRTMNRVPTLARSAMPAPDALELTGSNRVPAPHSVRPVRTADGGYSGAGIAGFVLGILAIITAPFFLGGILGLIGIILSAVSMKNHLKRGRGLAVAGLVLSIVAIAIALIFFMLVCLGGQAQQWNREQWDKTRQQHPLPDDKLLN